MAAPDYVRGNLGAVEWRPESRSAVITLPQQLPSVSAPSGTATIEAHFVADVYDQARERLTPGVEIVVEVDPTDCAANCRLHARQIQLIVPAERRIGEAFPTIRPTAS